MTVKDYMCLPKKRLAELLVEYEQRYSAFPSDRLFPIAIQERTPMCYEPNGTCTNPFRDCINCPKTFTTGGSFITTTTIPVK